MNFVLNDEMKTLQLAGMLRAAGNQIDPRGFQRAVAQHVGQLGHIPAGAVKHPGKEVPQVVGEHLAGSHTGLGAQGLHLGPNLLARDGAAPAGAEDPIGGDCHALFLAVFLTGNTQILLTFPENYAIIQRL